MKIKMRTTASGPEGVLMAGKVVDVTQEVAKRYVEGGYAEWVEMPTPDPEPILERAVIPDVAEVRTRGRKPKVEQDET